MAKTVPSKARQAHSETDGAALRRALDHEAQAMRAGLLREFKRLQAPGGGVLAAGSSWTRPAPPDPVGRRDLPHSASGWSPPEGLDATTPAGRLQLQ